MALKQENRPGQVYDPEEDTQKSLGGPEDGKGELSAKDSASFDQIAAGIRESENNAKSNDGNKSSTNANEKSLEEDSSSTIPFDNDDDTKKAKGIKARFTRKRVSIGGFVTAGLFTAIVSIIGTGPGLIINQIADLINGKIGEVSINDTRRYRRKNFHKITDRFSVDGRRGGAIIAEMERVGYEFRFDGDNNNQIRGISRPGSDQFVFGESLSSELDEFMEKRHPFRTARWKSKRMEAFHTRYKVPRKSIVTPEAGAGTSPADAEAEFNRRYLAAIDGEGLDVNTSRASIPEGATQEEIDEINNTNAAEDLAKNQGYFEDLDRFVKEGGSLEDYPDQKLVSAWREASTGAGEGILRAGQELADGVSLAGKVGGTVKSIGLSTDLADKLCIIKKRLQLAITAARIYRSASLIRYGLAFVTASDGIKKGEASAGLIRELTKRIVSPDSNGRFIGESAGFSSALNGSFSKSRNDVTRSGFAVDGQLTGVFKEIQEKSDIPGCAIWQNVYFQGAQVVGEIALAIFTLGGGSAAKKAAMEGIELAVETGVRNSIRRAIQSRVVKQIGRDIALQLALELSFEGIMAITQIYAEKTLSTDFLGQEAGAEGGDILTAGAGAATKQRGLASGQIPSSPDEYTTAYNNNIAFKKEQLREQAMFARVFDNNNLDSLAFSTLSNVAVNMNNPTTVASTIQSSLLSAPQDIASTFIGIGGGKIYAQETDDDQIVFDTYTTVGDNSGIPLATDHAGNLLTFMPEDIIDIDPIENLESLVSQGYVDSDTEEPIGDFAAHVENCVDSIDTITMIETGDSSNPAEDCLAEQQITRQFKAHLAYLDMLDGLEAEFLPEDISSGGLRVETGPGSASTNLSAPGLNGYAIPCEGIPTPVIRLNSGDAPHADWSSRQSSGTLSPNGSDGSPINVYIREACPGAANIKTVFIASSVHGSENGGQLVSHELLYNADLPENIRIIAVPEINKYGIEFRDSNGFGGRVNGEGVNLNRNFDYNWGSLPTGSGGTNYKGDSPGSSPEAQALIGFVNSINIDLAIHYHDNIRYVAAVGNSTPLSLAQTYGSLSPTSPLRSAENGRVYQRGSFDGWQNETFGTPVLLVEMAQDQSQGIINQHVSAVQGVVRAGGF